MVESITAAAARRLALAAQGFAGSPPATVGTRQLNIALQRLGVLQIDSVNVFERSHYLPLFARLGGYDKALLDRLTMTPRSPYVESWAHVAAFIPRAAWPLFRWRREEARARHRSKPDSWASTHTELIQSVLDDLALNGPQLASELEQETDVRRGPWFDWSDVKHALEYLFMCGDVVVMGRWNFQRRYGLAEQALPAALLDEVVSEEDAQRELVRRAVRALGIGTTKDIADYFRMPVAATASALRDLIESGEVAKVGVAGWKSPAFLDPAQKIPRRIERAALLSPFDPVVWERDRTLRLFDFHYRIEIYTPPALRQFGYYTLPVLVDDQIVGRIDLKNDRQRKVLMVQSAWREERAPSGIEQRIAPLLAQTAQWQGLEGIEVADWGDLSHDLAGELGVQVTPRT